MLPGDEMRVVCAGVCEYQCVYIGEEFMIAENFVVFGVDGTSRADFRGPGAVCVRSRLER